MKRLLVIYLFSLGCYSASVAHADTFGNGGNSFDIEFVPVGDAGNASDLPFIWGDVSYRYRIGKFEISEQIIDKANAEGGLGITKDTRGPDKPATSITWFEAAKFVNWLNQDAGFPAAYKFDSGGNFQLWQRTDPGFDPNNLYRNRHARYVLPSTDEWYKAAYYDPVGDVYYDYPTGSDTVPDGIDSVGDLLFDAVFYDGASNPQPNDITNVGLLSPFGTAGQGGNVLEWEETASNLNNDEATEHRRIQGGSWVTSANLLASSHLGGGVAPLVENGTVGFRVASIPEPHAVILFTFGWMSAVLSRSTSTQPRAFLG
jgi:sulfatase modifying factor 1